LWQNNIQLHTLSDFDVLKRDLGELLNTSATQLTMGKELVVKHKFLMKSIALPERLKHLSVAELHDWIEEFDLKYSHRFA
jgi:hypothetical protein